MKKAVCPGSFDPITNGHLDIISRASKIFDQVTILISHNMDKNCAFTVEERARFVQLATTDYSNVQVDVFDGLLAQYIEKHQIVAIVKGLRAISDFEYEFQMALANRMLAEKAETIFLPTSTQHMYLSSSLVKQIAQFEGDITPFVPESIREEVFNKLKKRRADHERK